MANFRRDFNDRGGGNRGGGRFFGGRGGGFSRGDDRPREMFRTVCSNCGNPCEVPFRPTTGKPVYCSDCFEKMGGRGSSAGSLERDRRNDGPQAPRSDQYKTQFIELNEKLDKILKLLKPVEVEKIEVKEELKEEPKMEKVVKTSKVKKASKIKG